LIFFVTGSVIGSVHLPWWSQLPAFGRVSLLQALGWPGALAVQLLALAVLYAAAGGIERRRYGSSEPLTGAPESARGLQRLVFGPWPALWGALALALLSLATLLVAGHPWSITFAFGLWGTKIWTALGGDISSWTYWNHGYPAAALGNSVLADPTSVMDMGIVLGAMLAAGLAGRFAPAEPVKARDVLSAVAGGLLLGYGARLAYGCNIGGLLAGLVSGSLHGWLWLASGFAGSFIGVYLRQGFGLDKAAEQVA
jgi:uncharacterized membrane protein YedE/YeeE